MARTLDVYLHRQLVGSLIQDNHGDMVFDYTDRWLSDPISIPLSQSLPLRRERYKREECKGFFGGILPDGDKRETIAKSYGISPKNDYSMLELIGGECAGAVTFIPSGQMLPGLEEHYRPLTNEELASILRQLPTRPLMADGVDNRISLAGAQDKIAVHIADGQISLPLGGAPTTHILKPANDRLEGIVFNELLCMNLAAKVGLTTATVEMSSVEGIDYLLVKRYDRIKIDRRYHLRLHQEDFCQALGIPSDNKYEREGGPRLRQCFQLLQEASSVPIIDIASLVDGVIFNFLIGNNDAHGKNFSLLYRGETRSELETSLAPFYDLLSTAYFFSGVSEKMAMKIGGEYVSERIYSRHFERLAKDVGLGVPMVLRRIRRLAESIMSKLPEVTTNNVPSEAVAELINSRCERTTKRFQE